VRTNKRFMPQIMPLLLEQIPNIFYFWIFIPFFAIEQMAVWDRGICRTPGISKGVGRAGKPLKTRHFQALQAHPDSPAPNKLRLLGRT
jgi:hypothetical protein